MSENSSLVERRLAEAAQVKDRLRAVAGDLERAIDLVTTALRRGNGVLVFGNGGSAADAQHIAAELEGRFYRNRKPLRVLALTTNTSSLTAIGNDLGYEQTFARLVEAHARPGDVVIAISTSGHSKNVLEAVKTARAIGAIVIGMTGQTGGKLRELCDLALCAPSTDVARIQECHITMGHILCEAVEANLCA